MEQMGISAVPIQALTATAAHCGNLSHKYQDGTAASERNPPETWVKNEGEGLEQPTNR